MSLKVEVEDVDTGRSCRRQMTISHSKEGVIGVHLDGGEPEDQSFYRDWAWVQDALLQAYSLGVQDGKAAAQQSASGAKEAVSNGLLGHGRLPRSAED